MLFISLATSITLYHPLICDHSEVHRGNNYPWLWKEALCNSNFARKCVVIILLVYHFFPIWLKSSSSCVCSGFFFPVNF